MSDFACSLAAALFVAYLILTAAFPAVATVYLFTEIM